MTDAYAQTATTATAPADANLKEPSPLTSMLPLLLIGVVFYFLIFRPQQKKVRDHADMVKNLRRGDKIVTGGGILGTVVKVDADALQVEIAPDIRVKVLPETIMSVAAKTGDAEAKKSESKSANDN